MTDERPALPRPEVVRLLEGGPAMTVEAHVGELLLCSWIDARGRVRRETFSPGQLAVCRPRHPAWLGVLARLSPKFKVVAATQ